MHLLEPLKEENFGLYSMSALELALLRCNAAFQNVLQKLSCRKIPMFCRFEVFLHAHTTRCNL